jgi:hypothetical protein
MQRRNFRLWGPAVLLACILIASGSRAEPIRVPGVQLAMKFQRPELDRLGPSALCRAAVRAAEIRHRLPAGLLMAMAKVETGRFDSATHQLEPWPWAVQAESRGLYFESKADAVRWVKEAMAKGIRSIDTGCLQVNLFFHPNAFASVEQAFDPASNADYAGRFLLRLHSMTGDWDRASGFYHSQELSRASAYRQRVRQVSGVSIPVTQSTILSKLRDAWRATIPTKTAAPGEIAR